MRVCVSGMRDGKCSRLKKKCVPRPWDGMKEVTVQQDFCKGLVP